MFDFVLGDWSPTRGLPGLGWPDDDNQVKPRMPVDLVLHQDRYRDAQSDALLAGIRDYDETMATYYAERTSSSRAGDWSRTTAAAVQGKKREHMLGFLHARRFFLR